MKFRDESEWRDVSDEKLKALLKLPIIEQKTPDWYEARHCVISASDLAQALGEGKFGTQRDLIIKKVDPPEYGVLDNPFFNWGNMFEQVANDIYCKMKNVKVYEFGLIKHPTVSYFAASPDGVTENGVMLEIKCPLKRKIGGDVPKQYYYQIQGQLDVCDLEECDYFECEFSLCKSVWEFDASGKTKGVFAKIVDRDGSKRYEYGPLVLAGDPDTCEIEAFASKYSEGLHYWMMNAYNMRRVTRDKAFINEKLTELKEVWESVVRYRKDRDAYRREIFNQVEIETEPANLRTTPDPGEREVRIPKFAFID